MSFKVPKIPGPVKCTGCGEKLGEESVTYCKKCMPLSGTGDIRYAPPNCCVGLKNGGYMDVQTVADFMVDVEEQRDVYAGIIGKLPWIKVDPCGHPIYPLVCINCNKELERLTLWCTNCQLGISIPCPDCATQAVAKHARGIYWCWKCNKEFVASVQETTFAVVTTVGE